MQYQGKYFWYNIAGHRPFAMHTKTGATVGKISVARVRTICLMCYGILTRLFSSITGVYRHADQVPHRIFPTCTDAMTCETIHPSVLEQPLPDALKDILGNNPDIVCKLLPLEEELWKKIIYVPGKYPSIPEPDESEGILKWAAKETSKKIVEVFYKCFGDR